MEQLSTLRATAQRLNSTPVDELPRIAGFLASSLSCCSLLRAEPIKGVDFSGTLHKLKVRLSSLLQDRNPAGRATAAVVIKAYVEGVPVESAQWEAWARGLITCLNKPDPWALKQLYIITVTRIFVLCRQSQTLQREVVSPLLPSFLNNALSALKPSAKYASRTNIRLMSSALSCWSQLLKDYSQTFRPFATRIRQICVGLLSDYETPRLLRDQATEVLCDLHLGAPKTTALADWNQTLASIISALHGTLDLVLRGLVEDWRPTGNKNADRSVKHHWQTPPQLSQVDAAGLGPWQGVYAGTERAKVLCHWLCCALDSQSQASEVPLGEIIDLLARIFGVVVPSAATSQRTSPEVGRDEKEELWASLPRLHIEALNLCEVIAKILDLAAVPVISTLVRHTIDVFEAEGWNESIRACCYTNLARYLQTSGDAFVDGVADGLPTLIRSCCRDLISSLEVPGPGKSLALGSAESKSTMSEWSGPASRRQRNIVRSAEDLMVAIYTHCPASRIPHALRTELDRTVVLFNSRRAITASVLNPPKHRMGSRAQPSLLPFLVQVGGTESSEVELLLRARMPSIGDDSSSRGAKESDAMPEIEDQEGTEGLAEDIPNQDVTDPGTLNDGVWEQVTEEHNMPPNGAASDDGAIKKRAFGIMLQSTLGVPKEAVPNDSGSHKKPRLGETWNEAASSEKPHGLQASAAGVEHENVRGSMAISAGEAIVMHSNEVSDPTVSARGPGDDGDDSDDDSDIPEINADLTDDEEDESAE